MLRPDYKMDAKLVEEIAEFVSPRSMIGTTYDLKEYVKQPVNITAKLYVDRDYNIDEIKANVETYIKQVTFFYGELQFGDSIVKSDLENEIKSTFEGILSFRISAPTEDIISPSAENNVLTLGTLSITAEYL